MKILYISYWGIEDSLTRSTVIPHLEILSRLDKVEDLTLMCVERDIEKIKSPESKPFKYHALFSKFRFNRFLNKAYDFFYFPRKISGFVKRNRIDLIIARGAPAGALALKAKKRYNTKLLVESFEPHADYMLESDVWAENSLSYRIQKKWEIELIKLADIIMTVSNNYYNKLKSEISSSTKIYVSPCAVDYNLFVYSEEFRRRIRTELKLNDTNLLGIYVGKFGDIYLKEEFYQTLKLILDQNDLNQFIILSGDDHKEINSMLKKFEIDIRRVTVKKVQHSEVPLYLSASDFALATIKPSRSRKYCSPIKIGEYWASGLPILIPNSIGDDSDIIFENCVGSELNLSNIEGSVQNFLELVKSRDRKEWYERVHPLAKKYRNFSIIEENYINTFKSFD